MRVKTLEEIKRQALPILKQYHVTKAALFGSYVRGEATQKSDIDILVQMPEHASLFDLVGLKLDLEESFGKKVDVVTYKGIKPRIKDTILSQQVHIL
ncbi:MAG: nucleotidyltransferase family protein [Candidatus Levybacteria bacterium]|nr:nucleotidyltransferase family protein [Candidatus Levybacteria bacterium]